MTNVEEMALSQFIFLKNLFKLYERYKEDMTKVLVKPFKMYLAKAETKQRVVNLLTTIIILTDVCPLIYTSFKSISRQINDKISPYHIKLIFN
ncbi:hypothetical protein QTN25_001098 [Entamoeba marina]